MEPGRIGTDRPPGREDAVTCQRRGQVVAMRRKQGREVRSLGEAMGPPTRKEDGAGSLAGMQSWLGGV